MKRRWNFLRSFIYICAAAAMILAIGALRYSTTKLPKPAWGTSVVAASEPVRPAMPERNSDREAYFGETHQHTSWSFDAYIFGNHVTGPADSYKYWKGETIKHPLGYDIKIGTPLDWGGVTDHSEYSGVVRLSNDPSSPLSKMPIAQKLIVHQPSDIQKIYLWLGTSITENKPIA